MAVVDSKFKKIIVKIDEEERKRLKATLVKLMNSFPHDIVDRPKFGVIGNKMYVSLKVTKESYEKIAEKILLNRFEIFKDDDSLDAVIENVAKVAGKGLEQASEAEIMERREKKKLLLQENLTEFALTGNYKEIIKVSRDNSFGPELVQFARELIPSSITIAVEELTHSGNDKNQASMSMAKLLRIASDSHLKTLSMIDLLKRAGNAAIDICAKHNLMFGRIIDIMTDPTLYSAVNVYAAVKFWDTVCDEQDRYVTHISNAIRNVNPKFLVDSLEIVKYEITTQEVKILTSFIEFLKKKQIVISTTLGDRS